MLVELFAPEELPVFRPVEEFLVFAVVFLPVDEVDLRFVPLDPLLFDAEPPLDAPLSRPPLVVRLAMPHTVSGPTSPVTPATEIQIRAECSGVSCDA